MTTTKKIDLYLDLDGVFADFEERIAELAGRPFHTVSKGFMWKLVNEDDHFFYNLGWIKAATPLWEHCKHWHPTILTGLPTGQKHQDDKRRWVAKYMGHDVPVIIVPRKNKKEYCKHPHAILIDDHPENIQMWRDHGGVGIYHKHDYDATLAELKRVVKEQQDEKAT